MKLELFAFDQFMSTKLPHGNKTKKGKNNKYTAAVGIYIYTGRLTNYPTNTVYNNIIYC